MTTWAVTVKAGGQFARGQARAGMLNWALAASRTRPAIVFVQEVPSPEWLGIWDEARYQVILGVDRGWKTRSALLAREDLDVEPVTTVSGLSCDDPAFGTLLYHESYVAVGLWRSTAGPVLLASVHASPQRAEPALYGWTGPVVTPRNGGSEGSVAAEQRGAPFRWRCSSR